jgi:hypothetical protein
MPLMTRTRIVLIAGAALLLAGAALAFEIISTRPLREAVRTYMQLEAAGNRVDLSVADRMAAARRLCSSHYLSTHSLSLGPEGGIVGLPRTISKNFQAWREGPNVWICPRDRTGAVYQFVPEGGRWLFDGLVAIISPRGGIVRTTEFPDPEAP